MFVLKPLLSDDEVKKALEGITGEITKEGGQIVESSVSPKQRLPYRLAKHDDGYCACIRFQASPASLGRLRDRFRLNQDVLRQLVTTSK